jgi:hypothetical protein
MIVRLGSPHCDNGRVPEKEKHTWPNNISTIDPKNNISLKAHFSAKQKNDASVNAY